MTELQILNVTTGELGRVLDADALLDAAGIEYVQSAELGELAEFIDNARELKAISTEAQGIASDELIRRMDMDGRWTLRTDVYEIKGASPDAGTMAYDTAKLRAALDTLVSDGVVSADGAHAALEVTQATAPVPYELLRRLRDYLEPGGLADEIDALLLAEPEPTYTPRLAGIKALRKNPAAKNTIDACAIDVQPPRRTARVKRAHA